MRLGVMYKPFALEHLRIISTEEFLPASYFVSFIFHFKQEVYLNNEKLDLKGKLSRILFCKCFLLVYGSYTGGFSVTFPYIHILYSDLVLPLHYSPSSPASLLKMTSVGFSIPYSCMYRRYLNHNQPPLPSSIILPLPLVPSS
jgi:hypothetical protein